MSGELYVKAIVGWGGQGPVRQLYKGGDRATYTVGQLFGLN